MTADKESNSITMDAGDVHARELDEVVKRYRTSATSGLTDAEAAARLKEYGRNVLETTGGRRPMSILLGQFTELLVLILIAACIVSAFLGEFLDSLAILAIVLLNGILGFVQEYRAERSLKALRELAAPKATVIRDGREILVDSSMIVPGDLVIVGAGDRIPCDLRLVEEHSLEADEAALTGESEPVQKNAEAVLGDNTPLGDRVNAAFTGTVVTYGRGTGIAVATGMRTELGRIATMVSEVALEDTPLQERLRKLGKVLLWACLAICAVIFGLGLLRNVPPNEMFLTSVSLAVAAIPEGLPAVVTIALALGVQRMVKRHAVVRRLSSVETLGSTTVICSDKTGTLTRNEMRLVGAYVSGKLYDVADGTDKEVRGLLSRALLCTANFIKTYERDDVSLETAKTNPTENAIIEAALSSGLDPAAMKTGIGFVDEVPFDSSRKRMTAVYDDASGSLFAIMKGAPEVIIERSTSAEMPDGIVGIAVVADELARVNADMAKRGLRVLAVASRRLDAGTEVTQDIEEEMTFAGFLAIADPPRPEVYDAVEKCNVAGIRPIMITGDHRATAAAIAEEVGILAGDDGRILSGREMDAISDERLADMVVDTDVFARVTPFHKLRIVRAFKKRGAVVAMTGDGVNDAPALKEADIGVAMGIAGTDVSKEASDMILTDDNFATIVAAVEEGRAIFANLKKFIHFLLSCNAGELLVMLLATIGGLPLPLLPIQILWINLATDGPPALALGVDPPEVGLLNKPPRPRHAFLFDRREITLIFVQGFIIGIISVGAFVLMLYVLGKDLALARTMAFSVMMLSQKFHAFNCRSQTRSIFAVGFFSNPWLVLSFISLFLIHVAIIYVPFCQEVFKTVPLSVNDWLLMIAISSIPLFAMEAYKFARGIIKRIRKEEDEYFGLFPA
ncbi:MAG: cation-translocating P-type ATPase [Candidatus Coatesbacteria bacterium]|nr:MAG: cation-translocating P-type ATPase [Candidatus Coatesbacteria bacterium]